MIQSLQIPFLVGAASELPMAEEGREQTYSGAAAWTKASNPMTFRSSFWVPELPVDRRSEEQTNCSFCVVPVGVVQQVVGLEVDPEELAAIGGL